MEQGRTHDRRAALIPVGLVVFRVGCTPFLFFLLLAGQREWVIGVFLLVVVSDFLDGYAAHQLNISSSSPVSAYLDSAADFIVVLAMFIGFVVTQIYPVWLLLVIVGLYLQFLLTSGPKGPRYDSVGKYAGFVFFGVVLMTLLFASSFTYGLALMVLSGYIALSLISRLVFLTRSRNRTSQSEG